MIKKTLILFCLLITITTTSFGQAIEEVNYPHMGNFRAWISQPAGPGPFPVIVYNYDEYWDWAKEEMALKRGYDLRAFMQEFNSWGYICIIPIERYRKINAIKGAIQFARKQPKADLRQIHIVGVSEGAFLSLLAPSGELQVASITLLTPTSVRTAGTDSVQQTKMILSHLKIPILYICASMDPIWKTNQSQKLLGILKDAKLEVSYREYPVSHTWFWNPKNDFMQDIYQFLKGEKLPVKLAI